jgi:hypothetical protein
VNFEYRQSSAAANWDQEGPVRLGDWVLAVPPNFVPAKILYPRTQAKPFFYQFFAVEARSPKYD